MKKFPFRRRKFLIIFFSLRPYFPCFCLLLLSEIWYITSMTLSSRKKTSFLTRKTPFQNKTFLDDNFFYSGRTFTRIHSFIDSFIPDIYIAPLQETYSEALSVQLRSKRNVLRSLQKEDNTTSRNMGWTNTWAALTCPKSPPMCSPA